MITDKLPSMEDIEKSTDDLREFLENLEVPETVDLSPAFKMLDILDKEIADADRALDDVENDIENLEENDTKDDVLKLFGDHANWQGDRFLPIMIYQRTDSPWEIADKVLR